MIAIIMEGGCIQQALSTMPDEKFVVADRDNIGMGEPDPLEGAEKEFKHEALMLVTPLDVPREKAFLFADRFDLDHYTVKAVTLEEACTKLVLAKLGMRVGTVPLEDLE